MSVVYSSAKNQFILDLWNNNNNNIDYFDNWYSLSTGVGKPRLLENKTTFVSTLGNITDNYKSAHNSFIDRMLKSEQSIKGLKSKLTVTNVEDNNMSTFRVSGLYSTIQSYWNDINKDKNKIKPFSSLLMCKNNSYTSLILDMTLSTDVKADGFSKMTKKMNTKELLYKSIFLDFWQALRPDTHAIYSNDDIPQLIIQPTAFSDKTSILNFVINPDYKVEIGLDRISIKDIMNNSEYNNKFMKLYKESVGSFYKKIFVNLFNDYSTIYETLKEGTKPSAIEANNKHVNLNDFDQLTSLYETIKAKESNENYEESRINETNKFKCKFADELLKYIGDSKLYNDLAHESNVDYETSFHYVKMEDSIEMNPIIRYNVGYLFNSDKNLSDR